MYSPAAWPKMSKNILMKNSWTIYMLADKVRDDQVKRSAEINLGGKVYDLLVIVVRSLGELVRINVCQGASHITSVRGQNRICAATNIENLDNRRLADQAFNERDPFLSHSVRVLVSYLRRHSYFGQGDIDGLIRRRLSIWLGSIHLGSAY